MAKKENKTVVLESEAGQEVTIESKGGSKLVVAIDNDRIVPDFVDAAALAVLSNKADFYVAINKVFHNERGSREALRATLAAARDSMFDSIKKEQKREEEAQ